MMQLEQILPKLEAFHDEVDRLVRNLFRIHRSRLQCGRGCYDCCIDGISVFQIEAERIRRAVPDLLEKGSPHPPGRCAFLSDTGECRAYSVRPYVCRTQGLPLRWIGETEDGSLAEARDICPLNEGGSPLEELPRRDCWTLGPWEDRLADLQKELDGGRGARVTLRDLFARRD